MGQILLVALFPTGVQAYEAFAGFQIDNQAQYLAYGGLRAPLGSPSWPVEPFFQLFAFRQRFLTRSEGQLLQGQLNQLAPAVGLSKSIGGLELQVSGGPAFRLSEEENAFKDEAGAVIREKETLTRVGYAVTGYASYSMDADMVEGLFSYTNLSNFSFGRLRWIDFAFETEGGTPINPGLELLFTGNSEFKQVYAGGLVGTEVGTIEVLLKGGYQNNSTFHSGAYGGIELYVKF